jgi:hypothetical protein
MPEDGAAPVCMAKPLSRRVAWFTGCKNAMSPF